MGLTCHFNSFKLFLSHNTTDRCYSSGEVLPDTDAVISTMYAAFFLDIIITVIFNTNIDNLLFYGTVTTVRFSRLSWEHFGPDHSFELITRKAMRAHAQRNAQM